MPVLVAIILQQCYAEEWSALLAVGRLCLPAHVASYTALLAVGIAFAVWEWPGTPLLDVLLVILANDLLTAVDAHSELLDNRRHVI